MEDGSESSSSSPSFCSFLKSISKRVSPREMLEVECKERVELVDIAEIGFMACRRPVA